MASSRLASGAWLALSFGLLALQPAFARADATSVAFLGVTSNEGNEALADAVGGALEREAGAVAEWRLERSPASIEQLTMAHDCEPAETECRAAMGAGLSAELGLFGVLRERTPGKQTVRVRLFRASNGESVGEASRDVDVAELEGDSLNEVVALLLASVRGLPAENEAPVEPAPVAPLPEEPSPATEAAPEEALEEQPEDDASPGPSAGEWIGYGLLGASAVSVGLTIYSWTQIVAAEKHEDYVAYNEAISEEGLRIDDVCAEAEANEAHGLTQVQLARVLEQCDRGSTYEVLQYVFIGAAVVTGGVGLYLVLASGSDDTSSASTSPRLLPRIGKDRASLALTMRF